MQHLEAEIKEIDKLFKQTKSLIAQGLDDAAYVYTEKIVDIVIRMITKTNPSIKIDTERINLRITQILAIYMNEDGIKIFTELQRIKRFTNGKYNQVFLDKLLIDTEKIVNWSKQFASEPNRFFKDIKVETKIPFQINSLQINHYQSLSKITLDDISLDTNFIVFTGNNGEGKTSILQAITIGLLTNTYDGNSYNLFDDENTVNLTIGYYHDNVYCTNILAEHSGSTSHAIINIKNSILAYGPSRLQLQSAESQDDERLKQSNIHGLFRTNSILQNINYWLKQQKKERREAIKVLLIKILPSISDIEITTNNGLVFIENKRKLKADQLSAGNKSILAMIGDMIIRLFHAQPKIKKVEDLHGIVLIDELETHLHPIWQKELPRLLADIFPKVQFIISTHSPIVFLGMPKNSVFFNVSKNDMGETEVHKLDIDIENLLPNQILTSPLFGMENIRSVDNKGIENLNVEDTFQDIIKREESKELLKELSQKFNFNPQQV